MDQLEARIAALLGRLDLEAKVRLLTGASHWTTWAEPAVGLRTMVLSDGPAGVRGRSWDERRPSASLPAPTAMAATWDEDLVERVGGFLAAEARAKEVDVLLGPTINLHRSPLGGRHFECFSEDPLLTARIGAAYVRGVQAGGVAATPKHYVANDSETERFTLDARVDERALRELYLAPFEHLVREAGAWLVMAAYNGVNGATMTEHPLLAEPLKGEWGFDGVVVSDWGAAHTTEAAGRAALDLVMPGPDGPWGDRLVAAVRAGAVPESAVDDKVRRLLRLAGRVGALEGATPAVAAGTPAGVVDNPGPPDPGSATLPVRGPQHPAGSDPAGSDPAESDPAGSHPAGSVPRVLARDVAAAGMVLVRNHGELLPLAVEGLRRVAVVGPNAAEPCVQGGGSATVYPARVVSPLDGLRAALGPGVEVGHATGARNRRGLRPVGDGQVTDPDTGRPGLRVRFRDAGGVVVHSERRLTGTLLYAGEEMVRRSATVEVAARLRARVGGDHACGVAGVGRFRLAAGDTVLVDEAVAADPGDAGGLLAAPQRAGRLRLTPGEEVELTLTHRLEPGAGAARLTLGVEEPALPDDQELERAAALAGRADAAVVVVGTTEEIESEGHDRASLALPGHQDELVRRVAAANPRTVVVVNAGSPVELPWRDAVPAVLLAWFPGQEFGDALADVLLGRVEPGGRLPTTWPATEADVPVLGTRPVDGRLEYREGIHVGYRAWARAGTTPAFPFGHGLGYTSWAYEELEAPTTAAAGEPVGVAVRLRNRGRRPGREVVQAYLSRPASALERPALWLAGFAAVRADPGQAVNARLRLDPRAFQHWSPETGAWATEPGPFLLSAGRSAGDRPLSAEITVT
jgi:beta-glucosidase